MREQNTVQNPITGTTAHFTVTFSEDVFGVSASDFVTVPSVGVTGTVAGVTGSGTTYTVTVNTITGNGTLALKLVDHDTITDIVIII